MVLLIALAIGFIIFLVILFRSNQKPKQRIVSRATPSRPHVIEQKPNKQKQIQPAVNFNYRGLDMDDDEPGKNRTVTIRSLIYTYSNGEIRPKPSIHGYCHLAEDERHFKAWRIEGSATLVSTGESAIFEDLIKPPLLSDCIDRDAIGEDINGAIPTFKTFENLIKSYNQNINISVSANKIKAGNIEITYIPPFDRAAIQVTYTNAGRLAKHVLEPYTKPWKLKRLNGKTSSYKSRVSMLNRLEQDLKEMSGVN